jgi:hypothetical protein
MGKKNKYKHCNKCNFCFTKEINHICLEDITKMDCCICLEYMHKSIKTGLTKLKCGHIIHTECINKFINDIIYISENKIVNCPLCRYNIIELNDNEYDSDSSIINSYYNNIIKYNDSFNSIRSINSDEDIHIIDFLTYNNIIRYNSFNSVSSINSDESIHTVDFLT